MANTRGYGGYGQSPYGRCQYGTSGSIIEPRFLTSQPPEGNLSQDGISWIEFKIYCYSSVLCIDISKYKPTLRISEDGGNTFIDGYTLPYAVDFLRDSAQILIVRVTKTSAWSTTTTIVIEFEAEDEFGNKTTKSAPVVWRDR